jgi:hypothetical protein
MPRVAKTHARTQPSMRPVQCHAKWANKNSPWFEAAISYIGSRRHSRLGYSSLLYRRQPHRYLIGADMKKYSLFNPSLALLGMRNHVINDF